MYLRYTTRKKDGKVHRTWRLVRSVRIGRRVIQQIVAHLGELDDARRLRARALARALIGDPELLVMDEPSLGLSPKLIDEYFDTVARIHAEGRTVLLIEQNAEKALSIADRGYLIVRGQIAVQGSRDQMLADDTIRHMYL